MNPPKQEEAPVARRFCLGLLVVALAASLPVAPPAAADLDRDGDAFSGDVETAACGNPQFRLALSLLNGAGGSCAGSDYTPGSFGAFSCAGSICQAEAVRIVGLQVNDDLNVPSLPLLPVEVPSLGPIPVGPLGATVVTLEGYKRDPDEYCVRATPTGGGTIEVACLAFDPLHDAAPATGPVAVGQVPQQSVGPTPGSEPGEFGSTPGHHQGATTLDVTVTAHWDESRLKRRVQSGALGSSTEAWEPVDTANPSEVQWWANNGQLTRLDFSFAWKDENGSVIEDGTVPIPMLGQLYAALSRSP